MGKNKEGKLIVPINVLRGLIMFNRTMSDIKVIDILTDNRVLAPKFCGFFNEELIYFYYNKDILNSNDNPHMNMYNAMISIPKDFFADTELYKLFPFDTGGFIKRLGKSLDDVLKYRLPNISDINYHVRLNFGDMDSYLSSKLNSTGLITEPFKLLDKSIRKKQTDKRILSIELAYNKEIDKSEILEVTLPRDYFTKDKKYVTYLKTSFGVKSIMKANYHNPISLSKFKDNYKIEKNAKDKLVKELEYGNYKHIYLHSTFNRVSCFCTLFFSKEKISHELKNTKAPKECYFSYDTKDLEFIEYNKIVFNRESVTNLISRNDSINRDQLMIDINIDYKIISRFNDLIFYKINHNLVFFGSFKSVIGMFFRIVGTIKDDFGTFSEIIQTVIDYQNATGSKLFYSLEKILKENIKYYQDKINFERNKMEQSTDNPYKFNFEKETMDLIKKDLMILNSKKVLTQDSYSVELVMNRGEQMDLKKAKSKILINENSKSEKIRRYKLSISRNEAMLSLCYKSSL